MASTAPTWSGLGVGLGFGVRVRVRVGVGVGVAVRVGVDGATTPSSQSMPYGEVLPTSPSAVSMVRCETSRSPHTRHSVAPVAE